MKCCRSFKIGFLAMVLVLSVMVVPGYSWTHDGNSGGSGYYGHSGHNGYNGHSGHNGYYNNHDNWRNRDYDRGGNDHGRYRDYGNRDWYGPHHPRLYSSDSRY